MSVTSILDTIYPITKEDRQCGFQRAKKLKARYQLAVMIDDYRQGKIETLPTNILYLLNQ